MSRSGKFVAPLAVAIALITEFGLTLACSNAAQLGVQPVSIHPTFDKKFFRAPNLGTQRTNGMVNSINRKRNISKGVSPDG